MKRPLLLCLVMLFSLMIIGTGYAGWSETVVINADAATGWLGVGIRCEDTDAWMCCRCRCRDPEEVSSPRISYTEGPRVCTIAGTDYYEFVNFTFQGGCSCCRTSATLEIGNGGTIPARIKDISLDWNGEGYIGSWTVCFPEGYQESGRGISDLLRAVRSALLDPQQTMRIELQFRPTCSAEEASCSIRVDFCRWNERL